MTSSPPRTPRPRRRRALLVLLALALAVGAAATTVLLLDDDDGDGSAEDAERADETTGEPEDEPSDEADVDEPARDTVGDPYSPDSGATGYDVTHYDIALRYDPEEGAIDGVTTITATATTDLAAFSVDLVDLEIERALVDGEEAEVETDGRDVSIEGPELIDAGDEFEAELAYSGVPEPVVSAGFPTGWLGTDDGGAYVIGEPDGAATWFPSNDHPSDKASLAIEVSVPRGWAAAANGAFEGRSREGRRLVWRWREDDPIATYLVTVAIDRYRMVEDETDDGLPLVSFYPEQDADRLEQAFGDTEAMIEVFEDRFGPYPFDEYGAIVVPEVLGLALETQTRSIFGIDVAEIEVFRAHELAHQWFGDSLTLRRWADIWLNEGFATYAELLWSEASDEGYDIDRDAASRRDTLVGFDEEPILDPGVDRWFSEAVYQRGALTLHALRRTVGDDDFFEILRRWAEDHRHGTVTTDEFVALAEEVSGEDLVELFDAWLRDDEIPELP